MTEAIKDRETAVLRALVQSHITSPSPVGSKTLSEGLLAGLRLSSATIRNSLAELDSKGYVSKSHTSSGRTPTEKGYRFYVNELMVARPVPPEQKRKISSLLEPRSADTAKIFRDISRLLNSFSGRTGLALLPAMSEAVIKKFSFIKVSPFRIQVVLVTAFAEVHNIIVELDEDWPENELTEMENFLNRHYAFGTLRQIRNRLERRIKRENARYNRLRRRLLKIQDGLFESGGDANLIVEGVESFFDAPEFRQDSRKLRKILKTLSDRKKMLTILGECLQAENVHVNIGSELSKVGIEDCSLVSFSFHLEDGAGGAVGILGPTRMDYPYLVGLLDYIFAEMNRRFAER
jgi:heat-inducible transcriptional repressor